MHFQKYSFELHFIITAILSISKAIDCVKLIKSQKHFINVLHSLFIKPTTEDIRSRVQCIICRQRFKEMDVVKLPCGHCFHGECIEAWTLNHSQCPICLKYIEELSVSNN